MAAASSLLLVLFLLVLAAPQLSLAAPVRPNPNTGRVIFQAARSLFKESAQDYLKNSAQQGFSGQRNKDDPLSSSAADTYDAFILDLSIGMVPQQIPVILDITSELIWVQCGSCPATACSRVTPAGTTTFMPDGSTGYVKCGSQYCQSVLHGKQPTCNDQHPACGYELDFYAAHAKERTYYTSGYLANDTFNFGPASIAGIVFGCSDNITVPGLDGYSGVLGFNRGALSLVTQLDIPRFSYFIAPDDSGQTIVSWDWDAASVAPTIGSHSTPLLEPTADQNPYYYVKLTGLLVDGQLLTTIPTGTFDVQADGSGGVFMSTTLPFTYLEQTAYNALRQELVTRMQSQVVVPVDPPGDFNHLCFLTQAFANAKVPRLALVFDGADAVMELTVKNYFFDLTDVGQTCLSILPSTGGSALGSLLQEGWMMTYDIHDGQLTFETAAGVPGQPQVPLIMVIILATLLGALQSLF